MLHRGCDPRKPLLEPDPVEQHPIPAGEQVSSILALLEELERGHGEEREVDVLARFVQHASFSLSDRRALEKRQHRPPELGDPTRLLGVGLRVVDDQDQVEIRPAVGRNVRARLRADDEKRLYVLALASPVRDRRCHQLYARVDVQQQALVDVQHLGVEASQRELAAIDASLQLREHPLRVDARQRSGLRDGTCLDELSEQVCRHERHIDREHEADVVRGGVQSSDHTVSRCSLDRPVVEHGKRQHELALLPHRENLVAGLVQDPPAALGKRLPPKVRECLRRAEALGRTAHEENPGGGRGHLRERNSLRAATSSTSVGCGSEKRGRSRSRSSTVRTDGARADVGSELWGRPK